MNYNKLKTNMKKLKYLVCLMFVIVYTEKFLYSQTKDIFKKFKISKIEEWITTDSKKPILKCIEVLDQYGNIIEKKTYDNNKLMKHEIYKYDNNHRLIEYIKYNDKDIIIEHEIYKYNEDNKKETKIELSSIGKTIKKTIYEYDDETGLLISKKIYSEGGKLEKVISYKYFKEQ